MNRMDQDQDQIKHRTVLEKIKPYIPGSGKGNNVSNV